MRPMARLSLPPPGEAAPKGRMRAFATEVLKRTMPWEDEFVAGAKVC